MQILSSHRGIDLERELHKVYRMFLDGQNSLVKLKGMYCVCCLLCLSSSPPSPGTDEATRSARSDSLSLPLRVSNLCELLVFVKNLELSVTAQPPPPIGTKYVTSLVSLWPL